jgi:hypothetical protein
MLRMVHMRNDRDPVEFLEKVMIAPQLPDMLRVHAASQLLKAPKNAVRFLSKQIDIEAPNSIDEAKEQIKQIIALERCRYIGCDEAKEQLDRLNLYIQAEQATDHEQRLRALERPGMPAIGLTVEGGLPPMPGTNITMPPRQLVVKPDEPPNNPWSSAKKDEP